MKKEINKAMCSVYPNLKFTMEVADDFKNKILPTLDFEMFVHNGQNTTFIS